MAQLLSITVADDPATWESLGFTVTDHAVRVGSTAFILAGVDATFPDGSPANNGFLDWILTADDGDMPASIDGIMTGSVIGSETPPSAPVHANGVTAIDHIVVSTPDLERTVAVFEDLGIECRRRREGAAYGSQAMRQAFFWLGEVILEVVGPAEVDPANADRPAAFFGIALTCADLQATGAYLGERMKPPVDAVQAGRKISTISSKAGAKIPIALMSPHVAPHET
jgi:catechol 2,3-dioxygenase-like lactoylglutathione lyase family enzyme